MSMRSIALAGVVNADRTLTVTVPADVPPGPCRVTVLVGEAGPSILDGLVLFDSVLTDPSETFRREALYGDPGP